MYFSLSKSCSTSSILNSNSSPKNYRKQHNHKIDRNINATLGGTIFSFFCIKHSLSPNQLKKRSNYKLICSWNHFITCPSKLFQTRKIQPNKKLISKTPIVGHFLSEKEGKVTVRKLFCYVPLRPTSTTRWDQSDVSTAK